MRQGNLLFRLGLWGRLHHSIDTSETLQSGFLPTKVGDMVHVIQDTVVGFGFAYVVCLFLYALAIHGLWPAIQWFIQ